MRMMRSLTGTALIVTGGLFMVIAHVLGYAVDNIEDPEQIAKFLTMSNQLNQSGLILVIVGILSFYLIKYMIRR